jgi:hypothetical protein
VINAVRGGTSIVNALVPSAGQTDILRFTSLTSSEVTASRSGIDLVIKVDGSDEQVTVTGQFIGYKPGLFGGDLNPVLGVGEIAFADGVVWDATDIAWAVAPNTDGVNGTLIGCDAMDVLDGARGNHFLSGGEQSGWIDVTGGCVAMSHHRQRGVACKLIAPSVRNATVPEYVRPKIVHSDVA